MAEFKINMEYCWSDGKGSTDLSADKKKKSRKAVVPATPIRRSTRVRDRQQESVDDDQVEEEAEMEVN